MSVFAYKLARTSVFVCAWTCRCGCLPLRVRICLYENAVANTHLRLFWYLCLCAQHAVDAKAPRVCVCARVCICIANLQVHQPAYYFYARNFVCKRKHMCVRKCELMGCCLLFDACYLMLAIFCLMSWV
jgi:hypothetical protein